MSVPFILLGLLSLEMYQGVLVPFVLVGDRLLLDLARRLRLLNRLQVVIVRDILRAGRVVDRGVVGIVLVVLGIDLPLRVEVVSAEPRRRNAIGNVTLQHFCRCGSILG